MWQVRTAEPKDMDSVERIYAVARHYMASNGNPTQWGDHFPPHELLEEDIRIGRLYVVEENGRVSGCFAFILGDDPTYAVMEGGSWEGNSPYGTIHRLASDGRSRGIFARCVAFCREQIGELRIDTHADNHTMQHLIIKQGFQRRGIIHEPDGSPRIAYQLTCCSANA